jgi:pyruvate/2-oxoglutarate dehydrogenase complex dihydrolipoamide acyltransferase (E2) component
VQFQRQVHIGLAVLLGEEGLIVPVVRDAQQKSLRRLAAEVGDLARHARARQLTPDELRSGTFTITNHGVSGWLFATPIISQPQSAILGVGAIQKRVVVMGDAIAIRPMVYLSLTFDHRLLDGASADAFLATIVATLEKGAFWPHSTCPSPKPSKRCAANPASRATSSSGSACPNGRRAMPHSRRAWPRR